MTDLLILRPFTRIAQACDDALSPITRRCPLVDISVGLLALKWLSNTVDLHKCGHKDLAFTFFTTCLFSMTAVEIIRRVSVNVLKLKGNDFVWHR